MDLPLLQSIQLNEVHGMEKLILKAPMLKKIKLWTSSLGSLDIVGGQSVEKLITCQLDSIPIRKLKNLKYLHCTGYDGFNSILLFNLKQLKEIHLDSISYIEDFFEQKRDYGPADLKIYLCGCLLDGPDDPVVDFCSDGFSEEFFDHWNRQMTENPSRLANEMPLFTSPTYPVIENAAPGSEINFLKRLTDLEEICVEDEHPVEDVQRFMGMLNCFKLLPKLWFICEQPQDLLDRLPEHGGIQSLAIWKEPSDLAFLFKMKRLVHLNVGWSIDAEFIQKAFEELQVLTKFEFNYKNHEVTIDIDHLKQTYVRLNGEWTHVANLNSAIRFIAQNLTQVRVDEDRFEGWERFFMDLDQ